MQSHHRSFLAVVSFGTALAALASAPAAWADDTATCVAAAERAQSLRDNHKLLAARDSSRTCGRASCPGAIQKDCITWEEQIATRIPSVVFSATDKSGAPLTHVKVTVDGKVVREELDGKAVDLDPGTHSVVFEAADGAHVERSILAREGEKNAQVTITLAGAPQHMAHAPAPKPEAPKGAGGLGYAGYTIGSIGAAGLVVGGIFGVLAIVEKGNAECTGSGSTLACANPSTAKSAYNVGTISTIGLVAGGVLAATGLTMVLVDGHKSSGLSVEASPVAYGTSGGGLLVHGSW